MITVHHLEHSRSQRIIWMLEELGVEYEIKHYKRHPKTRLAPPELKKIHPLGKSPIVTDGDLVLVESGAIVEYLAETYGKKQMIPKDRDDFLRYRYWLHAAEGSIAALVVAKVLFTATTQKPTPRLIQPITKAVAREVGKAYLDPSMKAHLEHMESELAQREWFASDAFSAADIVMSFPVEAAATQSGFGDRYPNLQAYLDRIHARPAYQTALEKGGPYKL